MLVKKYREVLGSVPSNGKLQVFLMYEMASCGNSRIEGWRILKPKVGVAAPVVIELYFADEFGLTLRKDENSLTAAEMLAGLKGVDGELEVEFRWIEPEKIVHSGPIGVLLRAHDSYQKDAPAGTTVLIAKCKRDSWPATYVTNPRPCAFPGMANVTFSGAAWLHPDQLYGMKLEFEHI